MILQLKYISLHLLSFQDKLTFDLFKEMSETITPIFSRIQNYSSVTNHELKGRHGKSEKSSASRFTF